MEKMISKLAGFGVPVLALIIAINATGYAGAAAITTALCAFGPGGMVGGVACLIATGTITTAISEYGMEAIFTGVVKELMKRGESKESILKKINRYPISRGLKAQLRELVEGA